VLQARGTSGLPSRKGLRAKFLTKVPIRSFSKSLTGHGRTTPKFFAASQVAAISHG